MKNHSENDNKDALEKITSELRTIRRLLTALLIGVLILIGILINPDLTITIATIGVCLWVLLVLAGALLNRAQRKRYEAMRFRELSGQAVSR